MSNFSSTPSKKSTFDSTAIKATPFGVPSKDSSLRAPSFLAVGGKAPSGHTPSTSRKTYDMPSYNPKMAKSSTSFGIIWLPGRKHNKKKDMVFSSMNYDKKTERAPATYNFMSGDSPDYQLHKSKDEETNHLIPEKVRGPIATAASAGTAAIILEDPPALPTDNEKKPLCHDKEESKEAAGDGNISVKEDPDYLENKDLVNKPPEISPKSTDKVDSIFITPSVIKSPPTQSATSNPDDDDCIIKCLYYTLQCCDCVIM